MRIQRFRRRNRIDNPEDGRESSICSRNVSRGSEGILHKRPDKTWRKSMPAQQRWTYRGCDFELWNNQQAWFWMRAGGNAVGATSSESEALAEVCSAIDPVSRTVP